MSQASGPRPATPRTGGAVPVREPAGGRIVFARMALLFIWPEGQVKLCGDSDGPGRRVGPVDPTEGGVTG